MIPDVSTHEKRRRICEWLRANGLDPDLIPEGDDIIINWNMFKPTTITVKSFVKLAGGGIALDPDDPYSARRVEITVPQKISWKEFRHG